MDLRAFSQVDIPTFTTWFNSLPNNDVWTEPFVHSRTVGDPAYDSALMLTAVVEGNPAGFLLGSVANDTGWVRAFVVRPDLRRLGIGRSLFGTFEKEMRRRGINDVTVGWAVPRYFLPGIDIAYTSAIVFLERLGYETDRNARVNMDVELTGRDFDTASAEARLADRGVAVRRARTADISAIRDLCEGQGYHGWAAETAMALEGTPPSIHVALLEDRVRGFAAHSVCGPIHFGPMLTDATLRGLGIGSVLLKRCLRDWQQEGLRRCEISWTGPIPFYARSVGATMGRAFWSYHRTLQESDA